MWPSQSPCRSGSSTWRQPVRVSGRRVPGDDLFPRRGLGAGPGGVNSYEVTQGYDEPATARRAQLRRISTAEHGAGQIRPAQGKHLYDRDTMRYESSMGSERSRL